MDIESKKTRLASYISLRTEVELLEDRLAHLRSEETIPPLRPGDGSQHTGGTGDRQERAVLRRMEYEERNGPKIRAARQEMDAIEGAVNALADPMERAILRLRYLEGDESRLVKWPAVALKIFGDDDERFIRAAQRFHKSALDHINLEDSTE